MWSTLSFQEDFFQNPGWNISPLPCNHPLSKTKLCWKLKNTIWFIKSAVLSYLTFYLHNNCSNRWDLFFFINHRKLIRIAHTCTLAMSWWLQLYSIVFKNFWNKKIRFAIRNVALTKRNFVSIRANEETKFLLTQRNFVSVHHQACEISSTLEQ